MSVAILTDHRVKIKENKKIEKYLDFAGEPKQKLWTMQVTVISVVVSALGTVPKGLERGLEQKRDHSDYNIVEIRQNTEKSSKD